MAATCNLLLTYLQALTTALTLVLTLSVACNVLLVGLLIGADEELAAWKKRVIKRWRDRRHARTP
jgi:hypothetical protein